MAGQPGMVRSRPTSDAHKDAILRAKIENKLSKHFDGKEKLSISQLRAADLLYARLRPTLSTVEQTLVDQRDKLSEAEVLAELQGLFTAKPELLDKLIELRDAARLVQEGREVVVVAQQLAPQAKAETV
jgi:hypothetical protein